MVYDESEYEVDSTDKMEKDATPLAWATIFVTLVIVTLLSRLS